MPVRERRPDPKGHGTALRFGATRVVSVSSPQKILIFIMHKIIFWVSETEVLFKIKLILFGCFDPTNIFFDNTNKQFPEGP